MGVRRELSHGSSTGTLVKYGRVVFEQTDTLTATLSTPSGGKVRS